MIEMRYAQLRKYQELTVEYAGLDMEVSKLENEVTIKIYDWKKTIIFVIQPNGSFTKNEQRAR